MRLGIYSGTFDPIHEGHVLFAQVAIEQFGLDKLLLMPEKEPRGKQGVTDIDQRESMALLATTEYVGSIEVFITEEVSHTLDGTLREIHSHYPDDEYFIVMGADVFGHIDKWDDDGNGSLAEVADKIGFIVGVDSVQQASDLKALAEKLGLNARFIEVPLKGVSSRRIRQRLAAKEAPHGLSDEVLDFVERNQLYVS